MAGEGSSGNGEESVFALFLYHPLATFLAGFRFLTIVPVQWKCEQDGRFFKASLILFPCIGLLIGLLCYAMVSLGSVFLPSQLSILLGLTLLAGVSGCLHLDGVADSCDGLLSSRPRERSLEIMRDSHTGAMGVIGLIFILLGKFAALSSLPLDLMLQSMLLMPLLGRTAILLTMAILPYARKSNGLGLLFYSPASRQIALVGGLFSLVVVLLISVAASPFVVLGLLVTVGGFSWWCFARFGGATGDTLGAVCELTELSVAVSFSIMATIS